MIDKKEKFITEISEEDFRKLNLKVMRNERVVLSENIPGHPVCQFMMVEKSINEILDEQITDILKAEYESDLMDLKTPVTIAIANDGDFYCDKYMNMYSGAQTYQIGWGIKHIYSTRDYFQTKNDDYWCVPKRQTKAIYRIHLDESWQKKFVMKHKSVISHYFADHDPGHDHAHYVIDNYVLDEKTGEWKFRDSEEVTQFSKHRTSYTSYNVTEKEE